VRSASRGDCLRADARTGLAIGGPNGGIRLRTASLLGWQLADNWTVAWWIMGDQLRLAALLVATVGWIVAAIALSLPLIVAMLGLAVLITYSGRAYKALDDRRQIHNHREPEDES
jgi:hypothetical protein